MYQYYHQRTKARWDDVTLLRLGVGFWKWDQWIFLRVVASWISLCFYDLLFSMLL